MHFRQCVKQLDPAIAVRRKALVCLKLYIAQHLGASAQAGTIYHTTYHTTYHTLELTLSMYMLSVPVSMNPITLTYSRLVQAVVSMCMKRRLMLSS